ncbi:MAG: alpha/beta hydrolase [Moraxellaceae bacterium]|nr:alpha/beta hydrolase [Moraxellaceae bacterium]
MSLHQGLDARLEPYDVLILPGWKNSGDDHWQSRWEARFPSFNRVHQQSWDNPVRIDWVAALDEAVSRCTKPVILIAHSLGCITVAHWASRHRHRIAGALLVAPADVERRTVAPVLKRFAPIPLAPLPFPALVIGSDNDPCCTVWRASELAEKWGAECHIAFGAGHINAHSNLGDWEEGLILLDVWLRGVQAFRDDVAQVA